MVNCKDTRKDFPMLDGKTLMHGKPLIYFDNGATTLKPQCVIDAVCEYLSSYSGNAHRGDYDLSHQVDVAYEEAREVVQHFIHAKRKEEVVFTSGATDSLNLIANGYAKTHLKAGDEILLNVAEHASNTLPWFDVAEETGAVVKYIELDEEGRMTLENVKKAVTENTKKVARCFYALEQDRADKKRYPAVNPIDSYSKYIEYPEYAHSKGIIVVADGAQSVPHIVTDVVRDDVDFLAFSGHKMCGPTGVGVLYGKYELLEKTKPTRFGGGSNSRYNSCGLVTLKEPPYKFEAGTPHIEGVIGLGAAVKYLQSIGMDNIRQRELELRHYAIEKMSQLDNVTVYNPNSEGAIAFNIKDVFAQDAASLFNTYGIAVRAGEHCAKILDEFLKVRTTCRVSFYFYNTEEEIDQFIEACKKGDDFLDAFFG